jgi:hypothetical protein
MPQIYYVDKDNIGELHVESFHERLTEFQIEVFSEYDNMHKNDLANNRAQFLFSV